MGLRKGIASKLIIAALVALLPACSDDASSPSGPQTGQFVDSPVEGLTYSAGGESGTTNANGEFTYYAGNTVSFMLGDILLGEGIAKRWMSPFDLVPGATDVTDQTVTNLARVLQTIDEDADVSNGIKINQAVQTAAAGKSLDFDQTPTDFGNDSNVQQVMSDLTSSLSGGPRSLTDPSTAQSALRRGALAIFEGLYRGSFSGDASGTWEVEISEGYMTGCGSGDGGDFTLTGYMVPDGSFSMGLYFNVPLNGESVPVLAPDVDIDGQCSLFGVITGTWQELGGSANGSMSGQPASGGGMCIVRRAIWQSE